MSQMKNKKDLRGILILGGIFLLLSASWVIGEILKKEISPIFSSFLLFVIAPLLPVLIMFLFLVYYRINLVQFWYIIIPIPIGIFLITKGIYLRHGDSTNIIKGNALMLAGSSCFLSVILLGGIILLIKIQNLKKDQKDKQNMEFPKLSDNKNKE